MNRGLPLAFALLLLCGLPGSAGSGGRPEGGAASGPAPRAGMPDRIVLGALSERFVPVSFDHAGHVDMAEGCGDCHHQHGQQKGAPCRGCHALDPSAFRKSIDAAKFRPCGACHAASPQAAVDARPGLMAAYHRACFGCHRDLGSVGEDPKGCAETCHVTAQ